MQIQTIKVKSTQTPENPSGFIVINRSDFDPAVHEPFDDEARAALLADAGGDDRQPTVAELQSAAARLEQMKADLDAEAARQAEQARANEAEAERLRQQAALQAETQRRLDEAAAAAAQASAQSIDPASMTKEQLQAALAAKGISFPAAANKADLLALLTGTPAA